MPITIKCPMCKQRTGGIPDKFRGKHGKCPKCEASLFVDACIVTDGEETPKQQNDHSVTPIPEQSTADSVWGIGIITAMLASATSGFTIWFAFYNPKMSDSDQTLLAIGSLATAIVTGFLVFLPFSALSAIISLLVKILRKL